MHVVPCAFTRTGKIPRRAERLVSEGAAFVLSDPSFVAKSDIATTEISNNRPVGMKIEGGFGLCNPCRGIRRSHACGLPMASESTVNFCQTNSFIALPVPRRRLYEVGERLCIE